AGRRSDLLPARSQVPHLRCREPFPSTARRRAGADGFSVRPRRPSALRGQPLFDRFGVLLSAELPNPDMAPGEPPLFELEAEARANQQAQRGERLSRIKKAVVSSIIIRPLALIIPLVTVALFPKYLGEERYGLYQLVGALVMWLGMTNLGLTMGLINKLID